LFDLLEALQNLQKGFPDVKLLIAGVGDRERELEERIRSSALESMVMRLGPLRGQEKLDLLATADVLVRTSRHEVFPEAYLEALSVGTPVAATPAGDTEYLARESDAIALLPFGDPKAQAAVIGGLLGSPERLARMRAGALGYARRERWDGRKELYWNCLQQAVEAKAA
jgi:glycosyltransferase involved in cell wall biosynthesis